MALVGWTPLTRSQANNRWVTRCADAALGLVAMILPPFAALCRGEKEKTTSF
jgi:hypothetical protein